jgi:hypothetical protein
MPAGHAFGDLGQLVGVAEAGEPGIDGLRVVPVAVQHDPASMAKRPAARAAATTSRVAAGVTVNDFSTRTAMPVASAARASARWCGCGVAT